MKQALPQPWCPRLSNFFLLAVLTISFSIAGFAQSLGVNPSAINFGSATVFTTSSKPEVVKNTGNTTLKLTRISAHGNAFGVNRPSLPLSLSPGASSSFNVTFTPHSKGSHSNSLVINFTWSSGGQSHSSSVSVAMLGIGATATTPCIPPNTLVNGVCTPPPPVCNPPNTVVNGLCTPPSDGMWTPPVNTTWTWWLSNVPPANNLPLQNIIDSDGVDTPASTVAAMHAAGKHWVCYVDVGTWEPGRPDAGQFPASVKGNSVDGFASEKWLDIRQTAILLPIMTARIQNCANKGADAVEPDDIDGYTNKPGFPFTRTDQIAYNKAIAGIVHSFGLSVALKNDGDDVGSLLQYFDFAIVEQCVQYNECSTYSPFVSAGKSVLVAEYKGNITSICSQLAALKMNGILTNLDLTGSITSCH